MTSQFSPKVSEILAFSREEANRLASRSVGPEHLVLGILRGKDSLLHSLFQRMNINESNVKTELEDRVRQDDITSAMITSELVLNEQANNILKLAVLEARIQHTQMVDVQHLVLAILHDQVNNGAKEILEENHMNYEDTLAYLKTQMSSNAKPTNSFGMPEEEEEEEEAMSQQGANRKQAFTKTSGSEQKKGTPVLDNFSTDLTQAAAEGKLDKVVGREKEILRVTEILCRRKKNNPILIGEPGVGKSAIVEGLAQLIVQHKTSPILFNKRVVNLDLTAVVAGTKYRGQFEERIRSLISELEKNPDIIVFIDEIHTMIGAGSTPGSMDAANIMKPALARGVIQCIGATTIDEYRKSIEKDGALERRFQKVMVEPTSAEETLTILHNIKDRYEQHHHVSYTDEALKACVNLTERYVSDRYFPDKAIDALDEVGSRVHLQHAEMPEELTEKQKELEETIQKKKQAVRNQNFELAAGYRDHQTTLEQEIEELNRQWTAGDNTLRQTVTEVEVADVVSMMAGVPVQRIAEAENVRLRNMETVLKEQVIAQDNAIEKMVKAIQRNRVGIKDPNHPIGVFMFLGPTGVGKTYLAKKLAEYMFGSDDALIRIDMSEYSESFNTSRLVGAPPGYVGYEEGGQLTEAVRRKPYSVVLFDEIEKAHPDVFNVLLQVLDDGRVTDSQGRTVDFKNTIIILTANLGSMQILDGIQENGEISKEAIDSVNDLLKASFRPEFLNRLDEIVFYKPLQKENIGKIVDLMLKDLKYRLSGKNLSLEVSEAAKDYIIEKGYDPNYGARPLKRLIQSEVETLIAKEIIKKDIPAGSVLKVDAVDGKLTVSE